MSPRRLLVRIFLREDMHGIYQHLGRISFECGDESQALTVLLSAVEDYIRAGHSDIDEFAPLILIKREHKLLTHLFAMSSYDPIEDPGLATVAEWEHYAKTILNGSFKKCARRIYTEDPFSSVANTNHIVACTRIIDTRYSHHQPSHTHREMPLSTLLFSTTSFVGAGGEEYTLQYKSQLTPEYPAKAVLVFAADVKASSHHIATRKAVVKFARTYGEQVHSLLASSDVPQAPHLFHCKFVQNIAMHVVVMEHVLNAVEVGDKLIKPAHIESLRKAVKLLHSHDFVHGDLRGPNMLLVGDKVLLLDFDWCGKVGTARYPIDIAIRDHSWHPDVAPGGLIKKEHDEHWFRLLTGEDLG